MAAYHRGPFFARSFSFEETTTDFFLYASLSYQLSTSSTTDERRNVGIATYVLEKVCETRKIFDIPLCSTNRGNVYRLRGQTGFDLGWLEAFYNRRTGGDTGLTLARVVFLPPVSNLLSSDRPSNYFFDLAITS